MLARVKAPGEARQKARRELGERLVTLRRRADLSQVELAKRLGELLGEAPPRTATMSAWENGTSEPQATEAEALARILGVGVDVLLGQDVLPPPAPRRDTIARMARTAGVDENELRREVEANLAAFDPPQD